MKYDTKNQYKVEVAKDYLSKLIEKGAWIELRELRMPRSIDSNRLYWLWLAAIETETGHDRNELHFLYRANFLQKDYEHFEMIINLDFWRNIKKKIEDYEYFQGMELVIDLISASTTCLETAQFSEYLDKIRKHARVNFGVILLTLEDKNFKEFYREYGYK